MQRILAAVVNPSLYKISDIAKVRLNDTPIVLDEWCVVSIIGKDARDWLDRQLTQTINDLPVYGKAVARLDRTAHISYYGILYPSGDGYDLLMPKELHHAVCSDVEKFVIMEEVELVEKIQCNPVFYAGPGEGKAIDFFGEMGRIKFEEASTDPSLANSFMSLCGIPRYGIEITGRELINETRLDDLAVNYDKGCFLGQETAGKIRTRRGANYGLMVLRGKGERPNCGDINIDEQKAGRITEVFQVNEEGEWVANAMLKREWRVLGATYNIEGEFRATVEAYPVFRDGGFNEKARSLYLAGVKKFEVGQEDEALRLLIRSIEYDKSYADSYEAIGVIHARNNNHAGAIEWMDKLLLVNPSSVMAHTNKSLAYMKMGEIEKAEAEKSEATVKSFAMFGNEAKSKKAKLEAAEKENAEMQRREEMFKQVLGIDEADLIALFGLGDICFKREQYSDSLSFIEKALVSNPKHSQSLLLKGKCLEKLGRKEEAIENYRKAIKIASAQGELMPANEMQSRLNQLL